MNLTFAGQTIEVTNGVYEGTNFHIHVSEVTENQWTCEIHIHRNGYEQSAAAQSTQPTAQEALDDAAGFFVSEVDDAIADDIDRINDIREMIAAHAGG
jgi:hypothetical protein